MPDDTPTPPVSPTPPPAPSTITQHIPLILAIIVWMGFLALVGVMCFHDIPEKNASIVNTALGTLGAACMMVAAFYFGSSASSQKKDDTIKQQLSQ